MRAILSHARLAGERPNFARNYWSGVYMADFDEDYSDAIFDDATLERTDFSNTELCGASFKMSNAAYLFAEDAAFINTDFTGANLTRALFKNTDLTGTVFTNTDLTRATFMGANLTGADFTGSTLKDTKFIRVTIHGETYSGTHLTVPIKGVNPV